MFKKNPSENQQTVTVLLDGQSKSLQSGVSVAAALLGEGEYVSRISPSSRKPCSPHCLMGICFECLMEIDGIQRQACVVETREGMVINRCLDADGEECR